MTAKSEQRMAILREHLGRDPSLAARLPEEQAQVVQAALDGASVYEIAQQQRLSEEAVWTLLGDAARLASGTEPEHAIEVGGFGSDTDPGATGGYGDTAFGSIGNEPPVPTPEEPDNDDARPQQPGEPREPGESRRL